VAECSADDVAKKLRFEQIIHSFANVPVAQLAVETVGMFPSRSDEVHMFEVMAAVLKDNG